MKEWIAIRFFVALYDDNVNAKLRANNDSLSLSKVNAVWVLPSSRVVVNSKHYDACDSGRSASKIVCTKSYIGWLTIQSSSCESWIVSGRVRDEKCFSLCILTLIVQSFGFGDNRDIEQIKEKIILDTNVTIYIFDNVH